MKPDRSVFSCLSLTPPPLEEERERKYLVSGGGKKHESRGRRKQKMKGDSVNEGGGQKKTWPVYHMPKPYFYPMKRLQ